MSPIEEMLEDQIVIVRGTRSKVNEITETLAAKRAVFYEENRSLFEDKQRFDEANMYAENKLRDLTIDAYRESPGIKKFADGKVGIRVQKKLVYEEKDAFAYAKAHGLFLKLDKPEFEKFAKGSTDWQDCVVEQPVAIIAQEL